MRDETFTVLAGKVIDDTTGVAAANKRHRFDIFMCAEVVDSGDASMQDT